MCKSKKNTTNTNFTINALVDGRITINMEKSLLLNNVNLIKTIPCKELYNAISYHPDIALCVLDKNNIVVAPNVFDYYQDVLKNYNINIIKGYSYLENKYPNNIQYNVALLGKFAIHNFNHTDKKILDYLEDNNFKKIQVKQGYSKCSTCVVDENSIITSDLSIHKASLENGLDSLLIDIGHIDLFELNYGFIGGCSGLISEDILAFTGNIKNHPDYHRIKSFVNSKNKTIIPLSDEPLLDLGSILKF